MGGVCEHLSDRIFSQALVLWYERVRIRGREGYRSNYWRWGYGVPETLTLLRIVRAGLGVATERVEIRVLVALSGHLGID